MRVLTFCLSMLVDQQYSARPSLQLDGRGVDTDWEAVAGGYRATFVPGDATGLVVRGADEQLTWGLGVATPWPQEVRFGELWSAGREPRTVN